MLASWPSTAAWLEPDSNQTSMMSFSLRNALPPHWHFVPDGRICEASRVYQESAPSRANRSTTVLFTSLDSRSLSQASQKKTAIGTPHTLCREMHQSGRVAIMLLIRSSPHAGIHLTFLISSSERCRSLQPSDGASMEINHCSVARKITGLWQRQQCGYECSSLSSAMSTPRAFSNSTMGWFALKTVRPSYSGRPLRRRPAPSTLQVWSSLYLSPV